MDFGKPLQNRGDGYESLATHKLCAIRSSSSVIIPAVILFPTSFKTRRAMRQEFLIFSISVEDFMSELVFNLYLS